MKKLTALLLSVVLVLGLAACGSANKPASSTTQPETSAPTEQPATEPSESSSTAPAESEPETQPETGKTLVVYYSASGNTERVAKDIAEAAGADLFEIVPTEVYTSEDLNWTNSDSRVSREHDDESLRDVPLTTTEVPDWDSYDTVFIGYPIWWGIAAWPVDTFVKNNDFTGKTVIPFATSSSSGMGQSGSLLADMAGTGEWQEGQRFSSGVSSDDVQSWVNGLGL
ncbi:flavodoxin [Hominiventricola filiformis]|uniref:Flavodoxin n=1 Tax=Hominiventricola filiformis TaxID=2885352 RepID=A0AAE3A7M0_9FIRM|nr:flavodoxin [Hominiventricola filiformis]MCC2125051.1 flavodoxin [Hominiventricola filiformis]